MLFRAVLQLDETTSALLQRRWVELCRADPTLPDDGRPPIAETMIHALAAALQQTDEPRSTESPTATLDSSVEEMIRQFANQSGSAETASAQLVWLRDAFDQIVIESLPEHDRLEGVRKLDAITQRAIIAVCHGELARLRSAVLTDPLTGLLNRRAFEEDLARACAHFDRINEPFAVAMIDLVGLKATNDTRGHAAGDAALRSMADAIRAGTRADDRGYRLGGDEFALLLPNTVLADPAGLILRLRDAGAPECTVGVASLPRDPRERLVDLADKRLYDARDTTVDR